MARLHSRRRRQDLRRRHRSGEAPQPRDRRRRARRVRRPLRLRQDDGAADDRGARGDHDRDDLVGDRILNDVDPRERDLAMVFQNYALYPHMSVTENIGFPLRLAGRLEEGARRARPCRRPHAWARGPPRPQAAPPLGRPAAARRDGAGDRRQPQAFLMDEPLSNLDAKLRVADASRDLRAPAGARRTTVYVTHDQVEAMTMGTASRSSGAASCSSSARPRTSTPRRGTFSSPGSSAARR